MTATPNGDQRLAVEPVYPDGPWRPLLPRWAVWLIGCAVIFAGIACLVLSDEAAPGWWQGTLQAFGVGFIIGGLVDVLAISALARLRGDEQMLQGIHARQDRMMYQILHDVETLRAELEVWQRTQDPNKSQQRAAGKLGH